MSGSYPPGVTGMEPEIAGYPECDECGTGYDPASYEACPGCGARFEEPNPQFDTVEEARGER